MRLPIRHLLGSMAALFAVACADSDTPATGPGAIDVAKHSSSVARDQAPGAARRKR
jgi:hypothetical protein